MQEYPVQEPQNENEAPQNHSQYAPPPEGGVPPGYAPWGYPGAVQMPVEDPAFAAARENLYKRVKNGRISLLLIGALSVINIVLYLLDASFSFAFSMTSPYFLLGIGEGVAELTGNRGLLFLAAIVACLIVSVFFLFYYFSKKYSWPGLVGLVLFSLDTLLLLFVVLADVGNIADYLIEAAFHVWAVCSLASLVGASFKLEKMNLPLNPHTKL